MLYLAVLTWLGLSALRRSRHTAEDYLLAGRTLGLPAFVATLVATWYGGILGIGEFTYRYGIASWLTQGVFFYICAILFALWIARRARAEIPYTIPDRLEQLYGRPVALVGAVLVYLMVSPAAYLLIVAILLQMATGWPLWLALLTGTVVSTWYALTGGFRAVVWTNVFQAVLMYVGFIVLLVFAVRQYGNPGMLPDRIPPEHLQPTGYLSVSQILVWGLIALWTFVDPGFYQRTVAARTGAVARNGILIAVGCWLVFDVLTITSGLYARAALPGIEPLHAYPLLADLLLPPVWKGLFAVTLLAVAMSTVDSFTFLSAVTVGRDVCFRCTQREDFLARYTRIGWCVTVAGAMLIAWTLQSVIEIWYTIGSIGLPGLLLPVIWSFTPFRPRPPRAALATMIGGSGTSLGWFLAGTFGDGYPWGWEPLYPGLLAACVVFWMPMKKKSEG